MEETVEDNFQDVHNERRWRLSYLQKQFKSLELHSLFNRYTQRIGHGYFSQFLSLQIIIITTHFIVLFALSPNPIEVLPDLILYGLISILSVIILIITDLYVKRHPKLLKFFTKGAFVIIFFANVFIPFYYRNDETGSNLRPAYTTFLLISNYILLNNQNILVASTLGIFVSVFHLVTLILVTYQNVDKLYERLGSDAIYLFCINGLGIYFRYMNEIVIRRSFLDRRSCVESTLQLKYEEDQENQLMSSIIPKHIIDSVLGSVINKETGQILSQAFDNLYIEEHENVTILFADIVNYTSMTTQLSINDLLETLNELFGRFDDASEELKVLRIKFLGDCYYCVAGLPPNPAPNHAEACVDLGLKMIDIIADIRRRRNLNVNMRIGIHTGKINSGIIGKVKWQYDIWSTDVDIANKMETEGEPGHVHVTRQTRELLTKPYNIIPHFKIVNNERTFLIIPHMVENSLDHQTDIIHNDTVPDDDNGSDTPSRRPTLYIKRTDTPTQDLSRYSISVNQSNGQRLPQNGIRFSETHLEENGDQKREIFPKRHTVPNGPERRISYRPRPNHIMVNRRILGERRLTPGDSKRRTAFMNNNIKRYKERLEETNKELEQTIEIMLLSKFEQWFKIDEMQRIFLTFRDLRRELDFIKTPDPLFKYYLLTVIGLILLIYVIENLTLSSWDWPNWEFYFTLGVIIIVLLPLSWTHHLWVNIVGNYESEKPKNKTVLFLYNSSKFITNNVYIRVTIYTAVYILFCICVLTEWVQCPTITIKLLSSTDSHRNRTTTLVEKILSIVLRTTGDPSVNFDRFCIVPWHMTETGALAIIMCYLFLRMYMWLKFVYASIITVVYSLCVWNFSGDFYGDSQTFNHSLIPQVSHILAVVFLTVTLHLVDRQTEYMNRLDHLWYNTLIERQRKASILQEVNKKLLKNILPIHVAELYLDVKRHSSDDLYHEYYKEAAVMFASIVGFSVEDMGNVFLKTMNTIICDFDTLLAADKFGRPIEKIKIAKWTYMAACGLVPGLGNTENIRRDQGNHVVISLLKFATGLMKKLNELAKETQQVDMKLRVGICYGPIVAGVVGSKKPLYDIWGDPVNMASRMDTCGVPNRIQVLKDTAEKIESFGYECEYRGETIVKGKDYPMSTYFVRLDQDFDLVQRCNSD